MQQPLTRWRLSLRSHALAWQGFSCRAGALAGLLLLGCTETPPPPEDYQRRPGAGCGDLPSECVDEETLWACVDRRWALVNCADECASRGGLVGCLTTEILASGGRCWCGDDAPECTPGQSECVSEQIVRVCDPETLDFVESTCESVCAAMEPPRIATKCSSGECECTLEGTPCVPGSPARCELTSLAQCVDSVWTVDGCLCSSGCNPWAPGGAACDC